MEFRDQIRRNRRRLLLFLLAALVLSAFAGRIVGKALLFTVDAELYYGLKPEPPWYASYPNHVAASLMLLVWVQYVRMRARGDLLLLGLVGARPLGERQFRNTAEEMAIAAGIETPRLYVAEDPSMNAFACSAGDRSAIVVTRGLLDRLDRDELQGVIAHETAHIRNGDTHLMTALFGLSRVFGMTAAFALGPLAAIFRAAREGEPAEDALPFHDRLKAIRLPPMRWRDQEEPSRGEMAATALLVPFLAVLLIAVALAVSLGLMAIFSLVARYLPWITLALALWTLWKLAGDEPMPKPRKPSGLLTLAPMGLMVGPAILLVGCVFPFVFWLLRLAISRNREFTADATAVELTRYPAGLCSALRKLLEDDTEATAFRPALSPLAIASVGATRRRRTEEGLSALARWLLSLVSTHPPLVERIARLEEMGAPRIEPELASAPSWA